MKEIYIIRHGETDLNKHGIVQGRGVDSSLNQTGIDQAALFFNHYKSIPFDHIYISSLKRTKETVQPFIDLNIPFSQIADLDELAWGIWEGQPVTEASQLAFKEIAEEWQAGNFDAKFENGESPNEVLSRLKRAMNLIMSQSEEKTILICMHGRALRLMMCYLMNQPLNEMINYPHRNTTLYRVLFDKENYSILDFNSSVHLDLK